MLGGVGDRDETGRTQCLFKGFSIIFMAECYKTGLVFVRRDDLDFALCFRIHFHDLGQHAFPVERFSDGTDKSACVSGPFERRRDVEALPGSDLVDGRLGPRDLHAAVLYLLIKRIDLFAFAERFIHAFRLFQELGRAHFLSVSKRVEHAAFSGSILVEDFHSTVDHRLVLLQLSDGRSRGKIGKVTALLIHLVQLDRALSLKELDDVFPVLLQTEDLNTLHIEYCHRENTSFSSK